MKIIDHHIHVVPYEMIPEHIKEGWLAVRFLRLVMSNPDELIKILDGANVEKAVIVSYPAPDVMGWGEELVRYVGEYCKKSPDRLYAFGSVHPRFTEDPKRSLEWQYSKLGIKGIKLHPVHQLFKPNGYKLEEGGMKNLEIIYEFASDLRLPLMIHTGTSVFPGARIKFGDSVYLDDVAVDFPKLKIVACHGGRPLWTDTGFFLVRRHSNVFLDISSIPPSKLLHYFPRLEEIADKTVFGSDWPGPGVISIKNNVEEFVKLPLRDEAKKKILYENACRILQ